jgi:hypothetical protein
LPGKTGLLAEKELQTGAPMNTTLRIDAASGAEIANQAPTITSAIIEAEKSTTEAIFLTFVSRAARALSQYYRWLQRTDKPW